MTRMLPISLIEIPLLSHLEQQNYAKSIACMIRAIIKYMSQICSEFAARNFCSMHAITQV